MLGMACLVIFIFFDRSNDWPVQLTQVTHMMEAMTWFNSRRWGLLRRLFTIITQPQVNVQSTFYHILDFIFLKIFLSLFKYFVKKYDSGQQIRLPNFRLAYLNFGNAYVIFKSPRHFWDQVGIPENHERANPYKLIPYDLGCILKLVIVPVCVVLCVSWSCGCWSHWNACMVVVIWCCHVRR